MDELTALKALATTLGIATEYVDGLHRPVTPSAETLVRVAAALGAPVRGPHDAADALRAVEAGRATELLPPVVVAWNGMLPPVPLPREGAWEATFLLEEGGIAPVAYEGANVTCHQPLPIGYHRLRLASGSRQATATVIAAPVRSWHREGGARWSWGVAAQLAALRTSRSRALGDLRDLEALCRWVRAQGGDLVTVLPLLPTFNTDPAEPSPYSPVSRLFWSELMLDLGDAHRPVPAAPRLDVRQADAEVRAALAGRPVPEQAWQDPELVRYARFRGAQVRLGRNWRAWPEAARHGELRDEDVDPEEMRHHLVAQLEARHQLGAIRERLDRDDMRLGLDLAVGVHPDGYDPWSRQALFGDGMSVGAPPDLGFPSGQDWGFAPVLPGASRAEGHRYLAASIGHQMALAGVLRVDHVMAWTRLYWIPHGLGLHQGTYVSYPADELFAVLSLESHRHRSEVIGENLGTVPRTITEALPRHGILGMYVAEFEAAGDQPLAGPSAAEVAMIGTHDTPTFAGWLASEDIHDRLQHGLLRPEAEAEARSGRAHAIRRLADHLGVPPDDREPFLGSLLAWLGRSPSPLVSCWLEDLWLEPAGVNLPGTPSSVRPNWQRPMRRLLDDVLTDPAVARLAHILAEARRQVAAAAHATT